MKNRLTRTLAAILALLMIVSALAVSTIPASAAVYRNGAQSGPSASYAAGRYYRNYQQVPITGDNRTDLIAIALSQLGYQEGAANGYFSGEISGSANYVEMSYNMGDLGLGYGGSDYPWCASFVSWCLYQSRCTNHATYSSLCRNHSGDYNYIWKEISCAMWVNQLKGAGYFSYSAGMGGSYTPQYGDLVFFKSSSSPSHIGICLYVKDGVLYTVEGNTSDASGLETNGGGVYFKSYSLSSSYLYGYGRLPYISDSSVDKVDYSGANPTPGLYVANAAKYIYSSEYATSATTTIPRFSVFEITKVGANNRLYGTFTDVNGSTVNGWVENNSSRIIQFYSSGALSGAWEYDGTGYKYKWSDGTYASQGWLQDPDNNAWYYIGANGYAQNGWLYLDTGTFYLDPNSNAMLTGHRYIDGRWYYFNNDGYLCDGTWEYDGTGYRYRYVDGTYGANCWLDDATNNYVRYYLDANGYSARGWQKIGDAWYYFDPNSGALLSGWLNIDNKWYYTDSSGAMQTGWVEEDGHYFYFDSSGARVENTTVDINGSTCTFDKNGVLVEGSVIEDTQTPNVGGGYSSYQGGMPADGTGVVQAHGIDISKWNNGDDWTTLKLNLAAVKAAGIDFVIIRCGSTNKGEDPMFDMYYDECKRLGLDVGAYFYSYALDAASAVSDAQKCLSYIAGKQFEYPIYMDFEDPTQEGIGSTLSAQICTAFLDTVASGGYLTGMYTYKSWFEQGWVDSSGISSKYEGWVTYPLTSQDHTKYDAQFSQKYGMYQYTFEYVIANAGTFDANVCYKDYPTIVKTYGFNGYSASSSGNLSASWVMDDYGLKYQYSDGTFAGAGWLWDSANSAWYYLDANGYAVSGWVEDNGKTYYLDPNTNAMLTGHRYIDNKWYYFDSSGALVTNGMWYQDENGFKYQMGDGTFVYSGWIDEPLSGARYYLDANGYAVSGFQTIDGSLYYFYPDSRALHRTGWITVDGIVYRTASDGEILKGFQYVDGEYFYFDESTGAIQTGFVTFDSKWYYFDTADGTMVTGWFTSPKTGYIYYFDQEGEMTTGWAELDGEWYFFEDNMENHYGQMLTGWITNSSSGYKYYTAEDGKMVTGWKEIDGNTYYFHPTDETYKGRMVTGEQVIDGETYTFDENGVLLASEPEVTDPTVTEPAVTEPAVTEPAVTEPAVTEPVATAPITGSLKVDVAGGTGFRISIDGGAARTQGTSYKNTNIKTGVKVTVTAFTTNDNPFLGWLNTSNDKILSTDLSYTFYTSGNDYLKAMYKTDIEGLSIVNFYYDVADQYWDIQYYAAGDEIVFPALDPMRAGFDFMGWNYTAEEIAQKVAAGEDVTVMPVWQRQEVYCNLTVTGGEITFGTAKDGMYLANSKTTVTANAPEEGMKFAYWTDGKKILSYETVYDFYPSEDMSLAAVFIGEDDEIDYQVLVAITNFLATEYGQWNFSWCVPEDQNNLQFVGAGMIATNKNTYKAETFYHGTTDSSVYDRLVVDDQAIGSAFYIGPVASGETWMARAWVQYTDASGQLYTVYSDLFEATKD
ncbi:MAG: hypothetical protein IJV88_07105 [Ruminococcus sp.]|nr:hypothetical protein [Ruminococcus sp.]